MALIHRKAATLSVHLAEIAAIFSASGFVIGCLGAHHWILDLFSHFRLQYLAAFAAAAIIFVIARRWKTSLLCAAAAVFLASTLLKYYRPFDVALPPGAIPLKLIAFNVNSANPRHTDVTEFLLRESADLVILLEVSPAWIVGLGPLHALYPFRYENPRRDDFGMAFLSKYPFEDRSPNASDHFGRPVVHALVQFSSQSVEIIGTHPDPPTSALSSASRDEMLAALLPAFPNPAPPHPLIVAGDFNLSQFSPRFDHLLRTSGLRDTAVGHGIPTTWMRANPLFTIPIDQAVISPGIAVIRRTTGPAMGSDHNPLVLELALPPR